MLQPKIGRRKVILVAWKRPRTKSLKKQSKPKKTKIKGPRPDGRVSGGLYSDFFCCFYLEQFYSVCRVKAFLVAKFWASYVSFSLTCPSLCVKMFPTYKKHWPRRVRGLRRCQRQKAIGWKPSPSPPAENPLGASLWTPVTGQYEAPVGPVNGCQEIDIVQFVEIWVEPRGKMIPSPQVGWGFCFGKEFNWATSLLMKEVHHHG